MHRSGVTRRLLAGAVGLALSAHPASAQNVAAGPDLSRWENRSIHETWTVEDGLPVNSVNYLIQTRDGYIWAATNDGLVRFDGVRFTLFNSTTNPGLPENRILELREGTDRTIWALTDRSVVRFRDGRFQELSGAEERRGVTPDLYQEPSGPTWVMGLGGLRQVRGDETVPLLDESVTGRITTLIRRRDGRLWAGTDGRGLFRLDEDPAGGKLRAVPVDPLDSAIVRTLSEDPSGRLWIGTVAHGIWTEQDGLRRLPGSDIALRDVMGFVHSDGDGQTFGYAASANFRVDPGGLVIMDARDGDARSTMPMVMDAEGTLWHATGSRLSRDGRQILALAPDGDDPLSGSVIRALLVDHEGSVWVATRSAGLHRVKPSLITTLSEAEGVAHRNVYPIAQDASGDIWIGSFGNGFSRVHADGTITSYPRSDGYPAFVYSLFTDSPDQLWVAAQGLLLRCSLPDVDCQEDAPPARGTTAHAFLRDSEGRLWSGYRSGPEVLVNGSWEVVPGWPDAGTVRAFAQTADGAIWMGTDQGGLVRYADGRFTRVTSESDGLPMDVIRSLHLDPDGWLWVGTGGRGLARLDPLAWTEGSGRTDRRIASVRARDGLFDEVIHQILDDGAGRFWMSTNRGIFWVTRGELNAFAEGRITQVRSTGYTERDGMRNREANGGMQPAGIRSRDGRLWFPTQDGVAVIDPDEVVTDRVPPPVVVERVIAGDSAVIPGAGAVEFGVDQRDLQVEFTALSFLEPANVRFRYRLDPYDPDWVEAGPRRTAFYTRVPPGQYTFRVMASNESTVWPGEEASVEVVFAPRFTETRAALLLALFALGLAGTGAYRLRVGSLRRREKELSLTVRARTEDLRRSEEELRQRNIQLAEQAETLAELHEARSRLFANLSHEFRTPLTLILGPLSGLLKGRHGAVAPGMREQHELMQRNGQRLLRLINQILDLSRIQAGALSLELRDGDLAAFVGATTRSLAPLMEQRGISLTFRADPPEFPCAFDPDQLETVLLNLLSNAAKFTEAGGSVEVAVEGGEGWAEISVTDSGIGIPESELSRVFDRFHQADASATRRFAGSGIGLTLARDLVELHGGSLTVESAPGEGSTFTVRLPRVAAGSKSANGAGPRGVPLRDEAEAGLAAELFPEDAPPPSALRVADTDDDRTTVLVVDDNADVRLYVNSVLRSRYRVLECRDGAEALETARAALPDLIVADVMMPELDGLGLGRALKDDPMTDTIPLVLLTARAAPEDQVAGLATGADAYLVKPFDAGVLEARVANLLEQRRRLRERFRQGEAVPPTTVTDTATDLDRRLRPLVEAGMVEPDFGPDALAAAAGLSYHKLYRALRDELGTTPSGFIRGVRADCAASLLRQGVGSVTEVAYSVGFESLSYFRRAFHERFEASPTEYLARRPAADATR